jgi:hypothetical protein
MAGPESREQQGNLDKEQVAAARGAPPGDFLSADFESDCARFVDEAKERARRRAEAGRRTQGPPRLRP